MNYELEVGKSLPIAFRSLDTTETRRNYARNPGAENTGTPSGTDWLGIGGSPATTTLSYSTVQKHSGATSLRADVTVAGQYGKKAGTPGLTLSAGETLVWSYWVYSTRAGTMQPYWEGSNPAYTGSGGGATVVIPANTWTKVTGQYTMPAGATTATVQGAGGYNLTVQVGDVVYLDEFLIEKTTSLGNYFDGTTAPSSGKTYSWTGAANASPAIESSFVPPLVAGSGTASPMNAATSVAFAPFNQGYETIPFTLEVWYLPLTNTGELTVVGHPGEGVIWDGTKFILRVRFSDGTTVESSWKPVEIQAFHVVMVSDARHAQLFINGTSVAAVDYPVSQFLATGLPITVNAGVGTGIYDSLALYARTLSEREIAAHYMWGNQVPDAVEIAGNKRGNTWSLLYSDVDILETLVFDSSNWSQGFSENVSVGDNLIPDTDDGGRWSGSIMLAAPVVPGVHLTYVGQGVTMEYSLDGTTWTATANKRTILEDATVTDRIIYLRLSLAAGGWVSSLRVDVLASRVMQPTSGQRTMSFKGVAFDQTPGNQLDYQSDWGATVFPVSGSGMVIALDPSESAQPVGAIEVWVKPNAYSSAPLIDGQKTDGSGTPWLTFSSAGTTTPGGGTVYINGVASNAPLPLGVWSHVVFVWVAASNAQVFVGRARGTGTGIDATFGHVATYDHILTAQEVANLYNLNIGAPMLRADDPGGATLSEDAPPVVFYAKSWSYVTGGR